MPAAVPSPTPSETCPFTPCLMLRKETLVVDRGEGFQDDFHEVSTAVIELHFDYGGVRVAAAESPAPRRGVRACRPVDRDHRAEAKVRRVLEGFGPLDLSCLDDCATIPGSHADYAVHLDGDPEALCAFSSEAVPRLRQMGWQVQVSDDYPCRVIERPTWYAALEASDDDRDWFELELGVEVEGQRVDLLPLLLELLAERGGVSAWQRVSTRPTVVPLGGGHFVSIPQARLRTIAGVLHELYRIDGGSGAGPLRIPAVVPGYLDRLDDAFEGEALTWTGDVVARERARALTRPDLRDPVDPPPGLRASLRGYQREGLTWLQNLRGHGAGGVLADDMGLGKTLQTIAHILAEKVSGRMRKPTLVVAPTSLIGNWQRELAKFAPSLRVVAYHGPGRRQARYRLPSADVVLTTYPIVVRDKDEFEGLSFYLTVLDEAQAIKNVRSLNHRTIKGIESQYRLALSGTPIENNLEELWALFDFVMPGLLGDLQHFRAAFRHPIEREGNAERMELLRERVGPYVLRRMKDTVAADLPSKTEIVHTVDLVDEQRDLYESIRLAAHATVRKAVKHKGIAASTIDILGALMKLRQACCDPRLVPVRAAADVKQSAKFTALFELVPEMLAQGRRILVFSQFTSMLALIGEELRVRGIAFASLTGSTHDRQTEVDAFQRGLVEVFLISLKAGGTGLNLTAADTVVHYDPWWNPAAQAQATDRAYRIGQKNPVFVYNLIVAGSVEDRMLALQRRKQALAEGLLGSQDDRQMQLSEREVDDLFAPLDSSA